MTPYRERLEAGHYSGNSETAAKPKKAAKAFTCADCGREFASEAGLKIHITKVHATEEGSE